MKLSEAIQLGCNVHPQNKTIERKSIKYPDPKFLIPNHFEIVPEYFAISAIMHEECIFSTDVLGAALVGAEAITGIPLVDLNFIAWDKAKEVWPMMSSEASCPECGLTYTLIRIMCHLNDDHDWTREQIAQWIIDNFEKQTEHP